jgi:FixJ family two-component response regulator
MADVALLKERLEAAIADLPPRLRAVVVLRDVYDLNHAEIAEELGISESAAKVRLHRARRKATQPGVSDAGRSGLRRGRGARPCGVKRSPTYFQA